MNREEFREQMTRCNVCGALMDGGCCPPEPIAFVHEIEHDIEGDESGPAEATITRHFYCEECVREAVDDEDYDHLTALYERKDVLNYFGNPEECYICGAPVV